MINLFSFFRKNVWPPNFHIPPWGDAPSIYDHILMHIDPDIEVGLSEEGYRLPDEPAPIPNKLSFAPGAMDGIMGHHGSSKPKVQLVSELHTGLKAVTENASDRNIRALYALIKDREVLGVIDALIESIQKTPDLNAGHLRVVMYWFATKAADREPVKFAMALLGLMRGNDDSEVFLTLGWHDEFTLYSAVAIASNEAYSEKVLWELAKKAKGWGRISTVERLAKTTDPDIKDWLLRDGYKNNVMYEYLACICARAGDLHIALQAERIDDDLFNSACEILDTLVSGEGGPAEGLADYEHGCAAIGSLVKHGKNKFSSAFHFSFTSKLKDRIATHLSGERRMEQDWSDSSARNIVDQLDETLANDSWAAVILEALENGDRQEFWHTSRMCHTLGIDPWPHFFKRIELGEDYWWDLMRTTDESRIDQVLDLAHSRIPLDQIATGPASEMGMGPEYSAHNALNFVLQGLCNFPGKGWEFIATGLQSPVIRNRNMAISALSSWGRQNWSDEAIATLNSLKNSEPETDVQSRIDDLLAGKKIN